MVSATGYNVFLIVVTCIAALMIAAVTIYLLAAFSHPEDRMQAWFPKIVVCCSIFVAIITVLMFPLDVANRQACDDQILFSDCNLTLPMLGMWYGVYIANIVLVYLITPFTLFYYEADSELTLMKRIRSAVIWTLLSVLVFGIILILVYAINGYVEYDTTLLTSGLQSVSQLEGLSSCIPGQDPVVTCSAFGPNAIEQVWSQQPSFLIFIIAVASILGWLLLMVMGGVGIVALPLDMILAFFARPKKTISKSEYMAMAKAIAMRTQELAAAAKELRNEENAQGRNRKWRARTKELGKRLVQLEDDEKELEKQFPQGEDRDHRWVIYVLSFWFSLFVGVIFAIVAITWIIHMIVYILVQPPLHPFLNAMFEALDNAFRLFGVAAFALWCFFLILAAIKGFTKLGLNFGFITLYPMKLGATMMSSFLVNSALILLASSAVVQFCATAFESYAQQTSIQEIFGNDIYHLQSVRPLFAYNVFIYIMLAFSVLTIAWLCIKGPTRRRKGPMSLEDTYAAG